MQIHLGHLGDDGTDAMNALQQAIDVFPTATPISKNDLTKLLGAMSDAVGYVVRQVPSLVSVVTAVAGADFVDVLTWGPIDLFFDSPPKRISASEFAQRIHDLITPLTDNLTKYIATYSEASNQTPDGQGVSVPFLYTDSVNLLQTCMVVIRGIVYAREDLGWLANFLVDALALFERLFQVAKSVVQFVGKVAVSAGEALESGFNLLTWFTRNAPYLVVGGVLILAIKYLRAK